MQMYQLNTTSNLYLPEEKILMTSFSGTNTMQPGPNETLSNAKKHFTKGPATQMTSTMTGESQNMKRLTNILNLRDDAANLEIRGTLSETLNTNSFHSPTHTASHTKSLRQKISNMKPITPSNHSTKEEGLSIKSPEYKKGISTAIRDSVSPQRDFGGALIKNPSKKGLHESPTKQQQQNKLKQINMIYRNNSVVDHLRQTTSSLNTSNTRGSSHSPSNTKHNPTAYLASYLQKGFGNSSGVTPSGSMSDLMHESVTVASTKNLHENGHRKFQSIGTTLGLEKGMLLKSKRNGSTKNTSQGSFIFLEKTYMNKTYQKEKLTSSTNPSSSVNTSFQSVTKEANGYSKSGNFNMEKFASDTTSNWQGGNVSLMTSDYIPPNPNKGDHLVSKVEALIANKSGEAQYLEQIGSVLDGFADSFFENEKNKEGAKARSLLSKIKLAYEVFFQNFSQSQNKKVVQAQDYQQRLEKDCEILESKMGEMGTEIELLQKENEKLVAQNKVPRDSALPSNSLATIKQNQVDHEETPPGTKTNQDLKPSEFETVKSIIASQQQTINSMKKKEAKMIRLLYACKKKGLDIEQIYYEDVKSSHDEEDIPTVNKSSNDHNSQGHNQFQPYQPGQGEYYYPSYPSSSEGQDGDVQEAQYVNESDYIEQSSEFDPYDSQNRPPTNEKSKANIAPGLKTQLKLDFSILNQAKQQKYQNHYISYEQKPKIESIVKKKESDSKKQPPALDLNNIKQEEEKSVGFHEEFMSKMDEFSVSWRQAAMKERKIP